MTQAKLRRHERHVAAAHLVVMIVAAMILITLVPVGRAAIGGSVSVKLLFLSRMILLLILATWLLRREKRGWHDVGLRRPSLWRCVAIIPIGLIMIGVAVTTQRHCSLARGIQVPTIPPSAHCGVTLSNTYSGSCR